MQARIDPVWAALKVLSENPCHGGGLWVKDMTYPVKVIFDTFSRYEKLSSIKMPHDEGCTVKYRDMNIVLYSPSWNVGRVNYTLAHEVGHIVLHHTGSEHDESEANRFASALLMPPCVMSFLKKNGMVRSPKDAARFFGVSLEAAAIAYEKCSAVTPFDARVMDIYRKRMASCKNRVAVSLDIFDDI